MLDLSPETEKLARRLAETQHVSVDEAVRRALEAQGKGERTDSASSVSRPDARRAALERAIAAMSALPDLDPRSSREIMDDLNSL